jgi:hypothetical protein
LISDLFRSLLSRNYGESKKFKMPRSYGGKLAIHHIGKQYGLSLSHGRWPKKILCAGAMKGRYEKRAGIIGEFEFLPTMHFVTPRLIADFF